MIDSYVVGVFYSDAKATEESEIEENFRGGKYQTQGSVSLRKEGAQRMSKAMRQFNRLLAYKDEFDPDYEWEEDTSNYCIYINRGKWYCDATIWTNSSTNIYFSQKQAKILVDKLNKGSVIL